MNGENDRPLETGTPDPPAELDQPSQPTELSPAFGADDSDASPEVEDPALAADRLGTRALAVDIVRRPRAAMRRLAAHPDRRWIVPLVTLAVLSALLAAAIALSPKSRAYQQAVAAAQLQRMMERRPDVFQGQSPEQLTAQANSGPAQVVGLVATFVAVIVVVVVGALLGAAVLHFMATILGGQQTFAQMLTVTAWGRAPLILKSALLLVFTALGGFDPHPGGLAGLVAADPLDPTAKASFLEPVLARVDIWNIWTLVLFVLGVQAVAHLSGRKAVITVLVLEGLLIVFGLFGTFIQRTLAGVFGLGG